MKKLIITLVLMQQEVLAFLNRNSAKFAGNQPVIDATTDLETRLGKGETFQQTAAKKTKGFAKSKQTNRNKLAELTVAMSCRVQSAYKGNNDEAGFENAHITYSEIAHGRLLDSVTKAQNIHDDAAAMSAGDKTKYLVGANDLTEMQDQIAMVSGLNTMKRSGVVQRKTAGKMLGDTTRETTKFIHDTVDALMGNYRVKDFNLYQEYLNSRVTVSAPGRHSQITGQVMIAGTTTPLPRVKVIASNGIKTYEDMTDTKGKYRLPVSPELYNVTFTMPSYQEGHVNDVLVDATQRLVVDAKMQKA